MRVPKCEYWPQPHIHTENTGREYCEVSGKYFTEPTGLSVEEWKRQRKQAWKQKKQEEEDAK